MKKIAFVLIFCLLVLFLSAQLIPVQNSGTGVVGTWNILVIPVEFNNWSHNQPISSTYNPYFAPVQIEDLNERYNSIAKDYYAMTSRGNVNVNFHVFPQWLNMGNMTTYAGSAFAPTSLLTGSINAYNNAYQNHPGWFHESYYDKTVIAFAGPVYQDEWAHEWTGTVWSVNQFIWAIAYLAGSNGKANCISAYSGVGVITHEMGHALFNLKDKDVSGRIPNYRYQLMGAGSWNGCDALSPYSYQVNDKYKNVVPSPIEPWIRVNLGWERQPLQLSGGSQSSRLLLAPVTDVGLVNDAQNYRNLIAVSAGSSYYLLENRQHNINLTSTPNVDWNVPNTKSWDIALPSEGILVWKITDSWRSSSGSDSGYSSISQLWSEVIDANPSTTTLPADYRYRYIDGHDSAIGPRTSAFNDLSGYNILGKYDAPIALGQSFSLPGTSVVITYEERFPDGSVHIRLDNVNQNLQDPAPIYAQAQIATNPDIFDITMATNSSANFNMQISNVGEEGSILNYSIELLQVSNPNSSRFGNGTRETEVSIGTGTDYNPRPFDTWLGMGRSVALLRATEIGNTGLITHLAWSVRTARTYNLPIKIWLKPTNETQVSTSTWNTNGATLVFDGSRAFNTTGWHSIDIVDYEYSGGNLLVLTEANFGANGTSSTIQFHNVTNATGLHAWTRSGMSSYTLDAKRPNILLTIAPANSLSLLSPIGGEIWRVGESRQISWQSTGQIPQINIQISSDAGSTWQSLVQNIANTGSYTWLIPDMVGNSVRIKVVSADDHTVYSGSATNFEISPFVPGFQFTSDLAGIRVSNGSIMNLGWNTIGDIPLVALDLSTNSGQSWTNLYLGANTGSYTWNVYAPLSQQCVLRLRNLENTEVVEISSIFEIYHAFTWLQAEPLTGSLAAGEFETIGLHVNTTSMYPGEYFAEIRINGSGETVVIPFGLVLTTQSTPIGVPQNIRIEANGNQIVLNWDNIPGAMYNIYASSQVAEGFELIGYTEQNSWSETVGTKRFYFIRATEFERK